MHDKYNILIQNFIDQEIEPLEKLMLEKHLFFCRRCRRELNQLKLLDWELKHQPAVELPPELTSCRMAALNNHFADGEPRRKSSPAGDLGRMQLQIMFHAAMFIGFNPVNRILNRTLRRSFSLLGKAAAASLKKRNPLLARFIPGRI